MSNRKQHARDIGTHPKTRAGTRRTGDNTALWIGLGSAAGIILIILLFSGKDPEKQAVQKKHEIEEITTEQTADSAAKQRQHEATEPETPAPADKEAPAHDTPVPDVSGGWETLKGTWTSAQGEIRYTGSGPRGIFLLKKRKWKYCEITVSIQSESGSAGAVFSYSAGRYIMARWNKGGTCEVVSVNGAEETCVQKSDCPESDPGSFATFKVDTRGKRVMIEINGSLIMQTPIIESVSEGYTGLMAEHTSSAVFRNFSVREISTAQCTMCEP